MKVVIYNCLRAWLWLATVYQVCSDEVEKSSTSTTVIPETPSVISVADDATSVSPHKTFINHIRTLKQEITNIGNVTKILIICPSVTTTPTSSDTFHDFDVSEAIGSALNESSVHDMRNVDYSENLSSPTKPTRSDKVDLGALEFERNPEVSVESQNCDQIAIDGGVPEWIERLSIENDDGNVTLPEGWAKDAHNMRKLWLRISKGLTISVSGKDDENNKEMPGGDRKAVSRITNLCTFLPDSLDMLDISHTYLEELRLDAICSSKLIRLEASDCSLHTIALCTPALTYLHLSANSLNGSLDWTSCDGGLATVEYLQVNQNYLTEVSTCGWYSLRSLDLRHNSITSLDLTRCPSINLTSVAAPHNQLVTPPLLPESLLHLNLNHNELWALPIITPTLLTAYFSHNNLVEIGKSRFKRARKLLQLSLAHNGITRIKEHDFNGLRELRTLDLSHNQLREIAGTSLMPLHHLRKLYLHHNHLKTLDSRDLAALIPRVHATTLYHNPWHCVCQLLSSLQRLQHCEECQPQVAPVKCKERGTWVSAAPILRTCLQAVQEVTQDLTNQSDEDLSEEEDDDGPGSKANQSAVVAVPVLLILIAVGAVIATGYRFYQRHKRTILARWNHYGFCQVCGCSPMAMGNGDINSHRHGELSQIERDSDTETEL